MTDINETETAERTAEIIRANKEDYNIYERRLANAVIVLRDRLAAQSGYAENEAQADVQTALIAQYDAIVAAVIKACPVVVHLETYDMYNTILEAITQHNPRKGAE